ncbi:retrotransposon protein, putative, ty1-copia subclass [Tanacetum coccineum]|uniref:Retrotransposon protein, putative, ty1-copia subclass n=1 Tax=Tanacetum coccineum TaxID=301880 RepID=A0ABQ4Y995_9ASTR
MGNALMHEPSFAPKPKNPPTPKKDNPAKDAICHQCGEVGHWRRNYPVYLAELLKKKKLSQGARTSSIFTIELYCFPSTSWVYDTGCGTHICITTQGLRGSRKLKPGALSLYVGNGHRAAVEAIVEFHLCLPSGLHCLGHISKKRIKKLQHDGLLDSTDIKSFEKCVSCMSGKMARKPYSHQVERAKDLLGLIHTDVCGPFGTVSRQGASYFVTFTGNFSRYGYVYLLKHKHEVFETFKVFQKEVENQLRKTIKSLRSDRGGEYMSQEFLDHLKEHGIIAHRTPPYTPQHNVLLGLCPSATRILNMVPTKKVDKTPYEVWHRQAPKLSYLKVWGCEALVKRDTLTKPGKLEPKSIKCIFVGYPKETMGYSFYYPPENKVFVAQNAKFFENSLITQEASGSLEDLGLHHEEDDQEINEPQSDINPIRKSSRTHRALDRMCLHVDDEEHELGDLVWDLVDLPPNGKTVGSKWLSKKKTDMDGAVHTFKARLVAKGFTQTYEVDYEETFSPVADIRDIRILIAIAAFYNYEIWQMDVKNAFLNGHLSEEVYMVQPDGFVNIKYPNRVCKLKHSIYGLKQASRQWNKRFDDEIKKFGFNQNHDEPCVYMKASESYVTFLILYVDDILIMGNNIPMLQDVKSYLGRCFAMKDLEEVAYILRIKIYRDRSKRLIGLCQSAYIEKILKRYFMENSKRGTIPMQEKLKLSKSQGALTPAEKQHMQNVPYASAVGSIMYVVRCTCPDVALTHNITRRFQHNPGELHWTTVKNIPKISCYTDAGYLTDADELKSQTGYVFVLNGGVVDWKSTKKNIFATSSTNAEYIVAFDASKEAVWIQKFIYGLGVVLTIEETINMYYDNTGAIAIAKYHGITKGARHFRAKVHYLRETIEIGDVRIEKVDTYDNLADPFTKALAFPKHSELTKKIGMIPASSLMYTDLSNSGASDPKLVKVNRFCKDSEAMVFTLSSRVWKSVSNVPPALGSRRSDCNQELAEVNDSLVVLADDYDDHDYYDEVRVCGVWIMDFVTKSFTKMFTIKQPTCKWPYHGLFGVLGFRKNGEVIIELEDGLNKSTLEVYEPSSGRINGIRINAQSYTQSVSLYQETLLLLDETSSIIP